MNPITHYDTMLALKVHHFGGYSILKKKKKTRYKKLVTHVKSLGEVRTIPYAFQPRRLCTIVACVYVSELTLPDTLILKSVV